MTGIGVTGTDAGNYSFNTTATTTADISARALTVSASGSNKVYDGNTTDVVTLSDNRVSGDALTVANSAANFVDKNVANNKAVSVTGINVTGTDAGNYTFNTTAAATANVTAKALSVTATGGNKVYDGLLTNSVTLADNRITNDVLTLANTAATFADKNVANGKAVSVTGITVTGTDAGNYTFNTTAAATANITAKALSVTATGGNKVYDGLLTNSVTLADNRITNDVLTLANTAATFADKNVANGKAVSVTGITVTGTDAGNYTFNTTAAATANITAKALSITDITASSKVYDGTTVAALTGGTIATGIANEALTFSGQIGTFADKNAATGKAVTVTNTTLANGTGGLASNYSVTQPTGLTADITAKALTVTANSDAKFVTQTDATGFNGVSYSGFVGGETSLTAGVLGGTLALARSNAGTQGAGVYSDVLTASGLTASNYTFSYLPGTYTIIPAGQLAIKVTNVNNVYGTAVSLAPASVQYMTLAGNVLTTLTQTAVTGSTYTYADTASGSVTFTLAATGGTNSSSGNLKVGNYVVGGTGITKVGNNFSDAPVFTGAIDVAQKTATLSASAVSKVYDGTLTGTGATVTVANALTNDVVTAPWRSSDLPRLCSRNLTHR